MAHIADRIRIAAPVETVFDTVADSRHEPAYNPAMKDVEKLTPGPVGLGTRFRAHMGRGGSPMLVELTGYDRPHRLASVTTGALMQTSGALTFREDGTGTVMSWDWEVRPKGWLRALGPAVGPLGSRMERRVWGGLKRHLEDSADHTG
jgi:hypothetical protein